MKKIKISLAAIAFIIAIGGALVTKASTSGDAACATTNPKVSGECNGLDQQPCCTLNGQQIRKPF